MRRVHRNLDDQQMAQLRQALAAQLPASDLPIGEVIRSMRLSIKRSQSEYAQLCGVSTRQLAAIEMGTGNPTLATLRALLLPFACDVGVVRLSDIELRKRRAARAPRRSSSS